MARPRGFVNYNPRGERAELLEQVRQVIEDYFQYLPMTLRQLFYQLVVKYAFEKTEKACDRLLEAMAMFRRGGLIPMEHFRDDGFRLQSPWWFDGRSDFVSYIKTLAEGYTADRQSGQQRRILLWSEAAGLIPQLQSAVGKFGVRVCSSGGFDSITTKHAMAKGFASEPTIVLHCGDFDPSGVHCYTSLEQDVIAFAKSYDGDCEFRRVAVLKEHITMFDDDLPTAPPKETDNRSFDGDETVQLEALSPVQLQTILMAQVEELVDAKAYAKAIKTERKDRTWLCDQVEKLNQEGEVA